MPYTHPRTHINIIEGSFLIASKLKISISIFNNKFSANM